MGEEDTILFLLICTFFRPRTRLCTITALEWAKITLFRTLLYARNAHKQLLLKRL